MTPKPTFSLEDLKKKALAVFEKDSWYIDGEDVRYDCSPSSTDMGFDSTVTVCTVPRISEKLDASKNVREYLAAVSPDVVLDLIERFKNLENTVRYYANPGIYAFPKTTNYGTSPFRARVGKSEIFVDLGMKARNTLETFGVR